MLNKQNMINIANGSYCDTLGMFNSGNGQSIREALLRQAVTSCDMYATDILVLLNGYSLHSMFDNNEYEIDIYFTSNGVEWIDSGSEVYQAPSLYRKVMKLVKDGCNISLYETSGNC